MPMSIGPTPPPPPPPPVRWSFAPTSKGGREGFIKEKKLQQGTLGALYIYAYLYTNAFSCPTNPFTELTTVLLRGERKGVEYVPRKAAQQTGRSLNGRKVLRWVALLSSACCLLLFCGTGTHKVRGHFSTL